MLKDKAYPGTKLTYRKFIPAMVMFIAVFILICLPEDSLPSERTWLNITFLDKLVHGLMFAIMTFLFLLPIAESSLYKKEKRFYFIRIALAFVIWGLTTEFIQKFFIPSRSFDLLDWLADCTGVLLAVIYCRKFHLR